MKRSVSTWLCLGGMIALGPLGWANVNDAPSTGAAEPANSTNSQSYNAISVRNVFDLKPNLSPPATNNQPAAVPPLNVRLIGITTIFGNKRATLGVQEGGKDKPKEDFYTMTEGERHGGLEVLEIHPSTKTPTVKIKKEESVSTITFETNKTTGPGPIAGGPQPLTMPGNGRPQPAGMSGGGPQSAPLPNRMMRSTPQGNAQQNFGATGYPSGYNNPAQPQPPVSPEMSSALMNLQNATAPSPQPASNVPPETPIGQQPGPSSGGAPTVYPPGLGPRVNGNFR